jgi:hypothetical protein
MSPTSLLNVSSELLRQHAQLGLPSSPMASASDRSWALGVCLVLAAVASVMILVFALANAA